MNIDYINSKNPKETKEAVDQLIDNHTRQQFEDIHDLDTYHYAISAVLKEHDPDVKGKERDLFIGGIAFRQQYDTAHVGALAVDPAFRGMNIGRQLIQEAEAFLEKKQVHTVTLSTLNYQALGFYQKLGYQLYGQLEDIPRRGMTKYLLYKRLSSY
ncbi:GNAT family N-acetyltransferase [Aerococcaceae bacterium WGS1372]